jgi:hypothetical protein
MRLKRLATAFAAAALMTTGASAATIGFSGASSHNSIVGSGHDGPLPSGYDLAYVRGDFKTALTGLFLDEATKVKFTYLGSEANNTNYLTSGSKSLDTATASIGDFFTAKLSGFLDFAVGTLLPIERASYIENDGVAESGIKNPRDFGIAYVQFDGDPAWYVFFDDIANGDRDFDDLIIKVELAKIPVPAAGFLLLGGMGALGAMSRRRKKS